MIDSMKQGLGFRICFYIVYTFSFILYHRSISFVK